MVEEEIPYPLRIIAGIIGVNVISGSYINTVPDLFFPGLQWVNCGNKVLIGNNDIVILFAIIAISRL